MRSLSCDIKASKIKVVLFAALVASGLGQIGASAADGEMSRNDMLEQAVALYEKLSGEEVALPTAVNVDSEEFLAKSVALGFLNADETDDELGSVSLRKQDAMTVLYKTIINFDDSYALSSGEVDEILNQCSDNALIDEENRAGYAFMIKHGIIDTKSDTDPDKNVTWESCKILVDVLYNEFMQDISFESPDVNVVIGANIESVISKAGDPDRIDESDYGFDWYVYNDDYSKFMMVGVDNGRICAFFSNSDAFSMGDISIGDSFTKTYKYQNDQNYRFFEKDGKIDGIMFNTQEKILESSEIDGSVRAAELVDLINADRVKNSLDILKLSETKWDDASEMAKQAKYKSLSQNNSVSHEQDGAIHESGYDVFGIYKKLVEGGSEVFDEDSNVIAVGTDTIEGYHTMTSMIVEKASRAELKSTREPSEAIMMGVSAEAAEATENDEQKSDDDYISFNDIFKQASRAARTETEGAETEQQEEESVELNEAPIILNPVNEAVIPEGEDCVIELEKSVANEYAVKIFSIEDEKYIVNSYIKTNDTLMSFSSELFESGKDYVISVSALTDNAVNDAEEVTVRYGEAKDEDVSVISPVSEDCIDDDRMLIEWESEKFHDFIVDIYDSEGKLVLSELIKDAKSAEVENIAPGEYYVYVSAVRRDDPEVIKVQKGVPVTIKLPQPVITEYILEPGEKFYPVYEDKEMGLLYFYDEDIVDVETVDQNGKTVTVKRKKITEKQVKNVNYYEQLSKLQKKVEYFEGSDKLQTVKSDEVQSIDLSGNISIDGKKIYDGEKGSAIVEEAEKYLGVPYVWGGTTPEGFDCSGLVQYVYKSLGIDISRVTYTQVNEGVEVSKEDLQPGDLVFFANNGDVHHVGIYAGNGMMIHAPYTGAVVEYQSIEEGSYADSFYCGRRVY